MKKNQLFKQLTIFLIVFLGFSPLLRAATIENITQGTTHTTIRDAVGAASTNDVLVLHEGIHVIEYSAFFLNLYKNLTITSKYYIDGNENWIEQTIIDGSDLDNTSVSVRNGNFTGVTFSNFTTSASTHHDPTYESLLYSYRSGLNISLTKDQEVVFDRCIFSNNSIGIQSCLINAYGSNASAIGDIDEDYNSIFFHNCEIKNNNGEGYFLVGSEEKIEFSNNSVHTNTFGDIFGVTSNEGSQEIFVAESNKIYANTCSSIFKVFEDVRAPLNYSISLEATFQNNLIYNNNVSNVFKDIPYRLFNHNTIANNIVEDKVILADLNGKDALILNSIVYGNTINGITIVDGESVNIEHCIVQGGQSINVSATSSNILNIVYADPKFVDPANNDFHVQDLSPCTGFATVTDIAVDIEGNSRPSLETDGAYPEIGALENTSNDNYKAYANNVFYTSIQDAVDALVDQTGTVYVMPGISYENVLISNFSGNITFRQFYNKTGIINQGNYRTLPKQLCSRVVIDGMRSGIALKVEGANSHDGRILIEGLTFQNGYSNNGGGFYASSLANAKVEMSAFKNNQSNYGAGVYFSYITGISAYNSSVWNCDFYNNIGGSGAGVYANSNSSFLVTGCKFDSNYSSGVVYETYNSSAKVSSSEFTNNTGYCTLYSYDSQEFDLSSCSIHDNSPQYYILNSYKTDDLSVYGTKIENNSTNYLCRVYDNNAIESAKFTNCLMRGNTIYYTALLAYYKNIEMLYTTISDNDYSSSSAYTIKYYGLSDASQKKTMSIQNSIIADADAYKQMYAYRNVDINIDHSNLFGGQSNVSLSSGAVLNYDTPTMLVGDPMLTGDGHLQDLSPCIGMAIEHADYKHDIDGVARTNYFTPNSTDMGAYENLLDNYAAENITVNKKYHTIADAINDASRDDAIVICPGEHKEFLNLDNIVLHIGSRFMIDGDKSWVDKTIVNGEYTRRLVNATGFGASFRGITFRNGISYSNQIEGNCFVTAYPDELYASQNPAFVFSNCIIENCSGRSDIFYATKATVTIKECLIQGNYCGEGSIIASEFQSGITVDKTIFQSNTAFAILTGANNCSFTRYAIIRNSLFSDNTISSYIIGASLRTETQINHCTFTRNNLLPIAYITTGESNDRSFLFQNNIVFGNEYNNVRLSGSSLKIVQNNILEGGTTSIVNNATGTVTISSVFNKDPLFIDDVEDFRLQENSPAIGEGIVSDANTEYDLRNNARNESSVDLGCYVAGAPLKSRCEEQSEQFVPLAQSENEVSVCPIPLGNTVKVNGEDIEKTDIYNNSGVLVISETATEINVSDLSNGMYIIVVTQQSGKVTSFKAMK